MGLSFAEWKIFTEAATRVARAVRDETGLRTVFHHHCAGYVERADEIAHFLELTDPDLIGLVFDTGHYAYGAADCDVVSGLARFWERVWYVHFKDCHSEVACCARQFEWDYFEALRHGLFCELGHGCVDFASTLPWLKDKDYQGYVLVEPDFLPGTGARIASLDRVARL